MRVIYEPHLEMYLVEIKEPETVTWVNTRDITKAREEFVKMMTRLFNDAVCEALKD